MDYKDFANRIKTKYPEYNDMNDEDLARRMVAKFPNDYSDVTFDMQSQPTAQDPSNLETIGSAISRITDSIPAVASAINPGYGLATDYLLRQAPENADKLGTAVTEKIGERGYPITGAVAGMATSIAANPLTYAPIPESPFNGIRGDALNSLANKAKTSADSRWFKSVGGSMPIAKEIGADEAARLGRFARNENIVTPLNSTESISNNISSELNKSGKKIGELRAIGDLYGNSPEASKIVQVINQDVATKYGSGIRSGEIGELNKAIDEVLKLEPVDKLTPTEEMAPKMQSGTSPVEDYQKFRTAQEDPNYIPEYDLHRPTTFNEVAKVSTDLNKYAKGQSKLLQPSGATTDVANVVSRLNDESLLRALPKEKGAEYTNQLQRYGDLSKLDRMIELKQDAEFGASRNRIVNNLVNRLQQKFGYQLSAAAMDKISSILKNSPNRINRQIQGINDAIKPGVYSLPKSLGLINREKRKSNIEKFITLISGSK